MNKTKRLLTFVAVAVAMAFAGEAAPADTTQKVAPADTTQKVATADTTKKAEVKPAPADTTKKVEPAKAEAKPQAKPEAKPAPADTTKKAEPAKAEAKPQAKPDAKPVPADTAKMHRSKMTYQDYQAKVRHEADSILSINYHHGITIAGARYDDKSYGDLVRDAEWGGGLGIYYFYRYYFSHIAFQGRAGIIYRYANFKDDKDVGHGELTSGHKYDLNQHMQLSYNNFAFDLPLTVKFGGHIEHTTFIYMSLTFGITKSLYEDMTSRYTLDIKDPSKELEEEIAILEKEGKATYPLTETHEIEKPFYMDDWETNGWVGVGIDGKYVSIGADFLVAAGSTKDNHRYYHMFQKDFPSFRVMIDFSLR